MKCINNILVRVLIDTGSSLNAMSKATLTNLSIDESYMKLNAMVVKGFDCSKRTIIGEIDLPNQI